MSAFLQILVGAVLQGALYTLGAFGLSLSFGVLKILNLSHGDFLMLGGFAGYFAFLYGGLNPFAAAVLVAVLVFGAGVGYYRALLARLPSGSFRRLLVSSVMVTLGTALAIEDLTSFLWGGGSTGIPYRMTSLVWGQTVFPLLRLVLLFATLALTLMLHVFLTRTFLGRAIVASTINREGALVVGIDVRTVAVVTFGLGVALAASAGVFYATLYTIEPFMGLALTLKYLAVIVVGGIGNLPGAFLGGFVIAASEAFTAHYAGPHWSPMVAFIILVLALLLRPQGLLGRE
ncbi:MAG: branched-chain amino acid ABC transporter permease [Candidatus Rokubacteria bacterium]|nr:branched-chain amino acid ABC transporter permease [Candidatus Rokubacteria bacterium]